MQGLSTFSYLTNDGKISLSKLVKLSLLKIKLVEMSLPLLFSALNGCRGVGPWKKAL